ncbi:FMN-binding negative transcriptional regulator [Mucilaginibacter galii]|uniref:Transcriptional regulator n=1 Tax=Mucilaginibacter galii TaxID=2005073 RepID=A0A917N1B9_9SPHI|nr:FMN-binding negative transcriptional regulator [Mucilaginibacter galii]GGI50691.1 transcriptional regulator [Mucilaginibacter galii]
MYIPKPFLITDHQESVAFMQRYSFATLINTADAVPVATHLPFIVKLENDQLILSSHLAVANPQSQHLINNTSLVVFTEPHAYVAPKLYEKTLNVPTWNYIAVHAYGKASIVTDEAAQLLSLEEMIASYDADYVKQWKTLPIDYKLKMAKGIVVFDILVTDLQGKKKLSQNRSTADFESVAKALTHSADLNEQTIGEYMNLEPRD